MNAEQRDSPNLNGGKTGWPPALLQDDSRALFRWFANRVDARWQLRQGLAAPPLKSKPE